MYPDIRFDWNQKRDVLNQRRYGIAFEEAVSIFFDEDARIIPDPYRSLEEEVFLIVGCSVKNRTLTVRCYRKRETLISIISVRNATRKEKEDYYRGKAS